MATSRTPLLALALACIAATSLSCRSSRLGALNVDVHPLPEDAGRLAAKEAAKLTVEIMNECNGFPLPWIPWTADVAVRGTAGSYRIDRQLKVGLWPNGSHVRIESVPQDKEDSFVLLISGGVVPSTTLVLDNGTRVMQSHTSAPLLAKIIGVPFEARHLEAFLRGCYPTEFGGFPTLYGDDRLLMPFAENGRAYYQRETGNGPWRLHTLFYPGTGLQPAWRMDLFDLQAGRPRRFVVNGITSKRLRIDMRLSNIAIASLPMTMFEAKIPSTSRPISLADINVARLLAP